MNHPTKTTERPHAAELEPGMDPNLFFKGHFALPPLPAVLQKLLALLRSEDANAGSVSELLATDPGLVAQILKMVNSAYFGLPRKINDVRHAVAYLGLAEIERVALSVGLMETLAPEDQAQFEQFWYHSFHTALAAKAIARKYGKHMDAEELHVAALLHDVGKLVYLKYFAEHSRRIADLCHEHALMTCDAESRLGIPSHTLFGGTLCERWQLPDAVKQVCKCHELKHLTSFNETGGGNQVLVTVCVANLLSNLANNEDLSEVTKTSIREQAMVALGCEEEEFVLLMAELYDLKGEVQQFLTQL